MLYAMHSWPEHANICQWPQAVDYAAWVFNHLPLIKNGVIPNEMYLVLGSPQTVSTVHMPLAVPFAPLILNYKMVTKYPDGNLMLALIVHQFLAITFVLGSAGVENSNWKNISPVSHCF
jgi:hypothetical protein